MKRIFIVLMILCVALGAHAQKYNSTSGSISFYSHATLEDLAADNKKVVSIMNVSTGDVAFSVPVKDFKFEKSLMEEHFNEKYMESDKYPKSTFQGKITGYTAGTAGAQPVKATGKLTIHGVTRDVEIPGTLELAGGKLALRAKFKVKLADYKVEIPKLLWQNIAEEVEVTVALDYQEAAAK